MFTPTRIEPGTVDYFSAKKVVLTNIEIPKL
jgi:hypothetical protein